MSIRTQLTAARDGRLIIQFSRPFEPGTFTGYVMSIGHHFFVLASLDDGFDFEQYVCLRIKDVRRLECPAKRAAFYKATRKLRGNKMPRSVKVDLSDTASALQSLSQSLLTIHRELADPETCKIGYALSTNGKILEMIEIDPDANWASEKTYLRLNQITRIDLPGRYESALLLVGGHPKLVKD